MNRLLEYIPPGLQEVKDFQALTEAEIPEFDSINDATVVILDDQFVGTASLRAVRRYEAILNIQANPTTEDLNFRRLRIQNRLSTKPPFTVRWLQSQLNRLVGDGMTVVSIDSENFMLFVTTNLENANIFREVQHTIQVVKPANMIYQQNTSLQHKISIKHTTTKRAINYQYRLNGTWRLGEKPFAILGPEVKV